MGDRERIANNVSISIDCIGTIFDADVNLYNVVPALTAMNDGGATPEKNDQH